MSTYTTDAVAMLRYLVDALPHGADEAYARAEAGIDVIWAPDVQLAEVLYQIARGGVVAGVELRGSPTNALSGLIDEGPVDVATIGVQELGAYGSIADQYSMNDGLLVASHRASGTDAIISKDQAFAGLETVWE